MSKFINIHTHLACKNSNICIKNIAFDEEIAQPFEQNRFYSVGLHPWDIEKFQNTNYAAKIEKKLQFPNFIALGEIGLDRAIQTDFALQKKVFSEQLIIAQKLKIPVIIHCVRAYSDVLQILKKSKSTVPLIFHDFNANNQIIKQLSKYNSYYSFGKSLFSAHSKFSSFFKEIPCEKIFFETDSSDIEIEKVYLQAQKLLEMDLEDLKKQVNTNFFNVFGRI